MQERLMLTNCRLRRRGLVVGPIAPDHCDVTNAHTASNTGVQADGTRRLFHFDQRVGSWLRSRDASATASAAASAAAVDGGRDDAAATASGGRGGEMATATAAAAVSAGDASNEDEDEETRLRQRLVQATQQKMEVLTHVYPLPPPFTHAYPLPPPFTHAYPLPPPFTHAYPLPPPFTHTTPSPPSSLHSRIPPPSSLHSRIPPPSTHAYPPPLAYTPLSSAGPGLVLAVRGNRRWGLRNTRNGHFDLAVSAANWEEEILLREGRVVTTLAVLVGAALHPRALETYAV
jgi:hypothetical protein